MPIDEFPLLLLVCKEWEQYGCMDELWKVTISSLCFYLLTDDYFFSKEFFRFKFVSRNIEGGWPVTTSGYKELFRKRHSDPEVGDRVEVAWEGKFRLEAAEVYQGRAWWVAQVVEKSSARAKYKVHYPGWDSRWDEIVDRSRLRWAVDKNITKRLKPRDLVEVWCLGSNVPGAWLEARIKKIKNGQYYMGKLLTSGSKMLWVERERLRPVTKRPLEAQPEPRRAPQTTDDISFTFGQQWTTSCIIM